MGQLHRVIAGGVLLLACGTPSEVPAPSEHPKIPRAKAAIVPPALDPRFDADGHLKPGSLKLSWFPIPLGFTVREGSTERRAAYEADGLTVDQVRDYVMSHAVPARIEYGRGEAYRRARAPDSQLLQPVDIQFYEVDAQAKRIRLLVDDLTPVEKPFQSITQAADALAKMRDRME